MVDTKKIDIYFDPQSSLSLMGNASHSKMKRTKLIKLLLPAFAALLTGLLIIIPQLKKNFKDIASESITFQKGELEKFHMENSIFYITDYKNIVNNFNADMLDEVEPGSKIIKLTNPQGTLPTTDNNEIHIKSPVGFYDQNTKILSLKDGVNLDYGTEMTTTTKEMFFDFNQSKGYGVNPIVTKSETAEISAQGFEYYKDKNLLIYTGKNHTVLKADNVDGEL